MKQMYCPEQTERPDSLIEENLRARRMAELAEDSDKSSYCTVIDSKKLIEDSKKTK